MKKPILLFHDLVYRFASQSECRSRSVGAIAVIDGTVVCEGWNSPPSKCHPSQCIRCNNKANGDVPAGTHLEDAICAHAEANLISAMAERGVRSKGAELWCTHMPCAECAKLIVRAGFASVNYFESYPSNYAEMILTQAGVSHQLAKPFDTPYSDANYILNLL